MAKNGFKIMDSDMHVIEPPDLRRRYIDPGFKEQGPQGLTETVADLFLELPLSRETEIKPMWYNCARWYGF